MVDLARPSAARSWALLLAYVACVLGALPFTRDLVLTLRGLDLLGAVIGALYVGALAGVTYHVVFDVHLSDWIAFFALVALAAIAGALLMGLQIPEERVHFLQYGLMAWLAGGALRWHLRPALAYLGALLFASGVGYGDEVLQDILPNRVYDIADVTLNVQAAVIGVVADEILHDRLGWRRRRDARI